ncbi:MAG: FkbM family methyltransferase [Candidatus Nezhaarchaeota archaeon]|nr:FkbM family methyltransferase [Candidatus Nezhaarchaeota archaeon]
MANLIKRVMLALRFMGFSVLFKEVLRRIYGDEVVVRTYFGDFYVDVADLELLRVLLEPLEGMYGFIDVKDSIVVDVGAYIGDTALYFLHKGALRVYALEPVDRHFKYLLKNMEKNNAVGRIIPLNYGAWFRNGTISVCCEGATTGLHTTMKTEVNTAIKVRHLGDLLREIYVKEGKIDLVKIDCEGCEHSLLTLSNDDIKLAKQYIIEIHGPANPIIDKMTQCGYKHKLIKSIGSLVTVYHFTR